MTGLDEYAGVIITGFFFVFLMCGSFIHFREENHHNEQARIAQGLQEK